MGHLSPSRADRSHGRSTFDSRQSCCSSENFCLVPEAEENLSGLGVVHHLLSSLGSAIRSAGRGVAHLSKKTTNIERV